MVGQETSLVEREALRERLGLNDSVIVQYVRYVDHQPRLTTSPRPKVGSQPKVTPTSGRGRT